MPWSDPITNKIIDIGLGDLNISKWSQDYMQLQEVDLHIVADKKEGKPALVDTVTQFK